MRRKYPVTTFLTLSLLAGVFVSVLVYFGVRKIDLAIIWGGLAFIVVLVGIATLALVVPESDSDPDKPVLH